LRVFVTGGTGLVGSHVTERLVDLGHEVRAMTRSKAGDRFVERLGAEAVRGCVEDRGSWEAAEGSHTLVHAAALVTTATTWDAYHQVNVEGTRHAAEMAAALGTRLIHVSSVAVYGRQPFSDDRNRVTEDVRFAPIAEADYYARSKREAEAVVWQTADRLGLSAVAIRPCVIYGERERLFMSRLLAILRHGIAPLVGSGENQLAMVYVGNVIDAIVNALEQPTVTGPFNTTNDGGITQRQFYEIVGEEIGRRIRMVKVPLAAAIAAGKAWHITSQILNPGRYTGLGSSSGRFMARENPYSSGRAERELQWAPSTAPHEALRRTVRWFVKESGGGAD
jgi:nucleoside-diphosphate-sugar epimerase